MIFGERNIKTLLKTLFAAVAIAFTSNGIAAEQWGLTQLMIDLGSVKEARATFVEKKYLKVLNTPLESSGKLIYIAPFRLEKYTLAPKQESMVVEQDTLTLARGSRKRTVQIQDYPVLWAFVESIRGTLKGDLSALEQFYQVELSGTQQAWQLALQPTDKKMVALIKTIKLQGSKERLNAIEIIEAEGDRSVMTVTADPS